MAPISERSAFSGVVESVGSKVAGVAPGDEVCAMTSMPMGAQAEYVALPATELARKPAAVTHEDAAGVLFRGTTALYFLQDAASVGTGTSVLVNGASGAIGTNAVKLATHFGATVTGATSAANSGLVTSLGVDRVIDYTTTDLSCVSERFGVVLDTVGNLSFTSGRRLLTADGKLLLAVAELGEAIPARGNVAAGAAPERVAGRAPSATRGRRPGHRRARSDLRPVRHRACASTRRLRPQARQPRRPPVITRTRA